MQLAQFIDHTLLKPSATVDEIETLCTEAVQHGFCAVCVPPYYVAVAGNILKGEKVKLATVIGFPFGYSHTTAKAAELKRVIEDGAQEADMVMNIAAFKNNDRTYLENELQLISKMAMENNVVLKLIVESGILTEEEIVRCCVLFRNFPIDFLKTSTGYAEKGATVEAVELMRRHLPQHIQIKASGGIRTYDFAKQLIEAGATRLGCSASVAIVNGAPAAEGGY